MDEQRMLELLNRGNIITGIRLSFVKKDSPVIKRKSRAEMDKKNPEKEEKLTINIF